MNMNNRKLAHFKDLVGGPDARNASRAAVILGNMGREANSALDKLKEQQDHPDEQARAAILKAIEKIEADIAEEQRERQDDR
ncbi:MAG: hypothetical protein KDA65_10445 [Planctomycetaceae bacterium]|nr:hypothetical protein [Planctomycetaceae bacterium]